jgi:hypothetical protein
VRPSRQRLKRLARQDANSCMDTKYVIGAVLFLTVSCNFSASMAGFIFNRN